MEGGKESVTQLIDKYTKESMELPNIQMNMVIAERVKSGRTTAKQAMEAFKKIFYNQKLKK